MTKKISVFLIIFFTFSFLIYLQNVKVIKDPKPTHFEKKFVRLKMVKKVSYDFDDENFIGKVGSVTADKEGNLYIYDSLQAKIFKLNKDLKYIKSFGREGRGPGEFGNSFSHMELNIGPENNLYISDSLTHRIHMFDTDGKFIKDYPVKFHGGFFPIITSLGNFIIPSNNNETVFTEYTKDMKVKRSVLNAKGSFNKFFYFKPDYMMLRFLTYPKYFFNYICKISPDGKKFVVFMINNVTYYLFNNFKLEKKMRILPKNVLENYKKYYLEDIMKTRESYQPFTRKLFFDLENSNFLYIQFLKEMDNLRDVLYRFSLSGVLDEVLYIKLSNNKEYRVFLLEKNSLFYVRDSEYFYIYKKQGEKK